MTGGLFDPLGVDRNEPGRSRGPRPSAPAVAAGVMLAALATLLAVSWLRDTGDRGRPVAVGPIERAPTQRPAPAAPPSSSPDFGAAPAPPPASPVQSIPAAPAGSTSPIPSQADQDVEIQNGVRVVRPRRQVAPPGSLPTGASSPGGQTLPVPDARAPR